MDPITTGLAGLLLSGFMAGAGLHRVPEGHVAVYYRGGALLDKIEKPGFHVKVPGVTQVAFVQTTVQTDNVRSIPCGTAGGTVITFDRIEVVNQLRQDAVHDIVKNFTTEYDKTWIYDKIHHEVNQICSRSTLEEMYISKFDSLDETLRDALQRDIDVWAPGITIIAIRVTKPTIPASIRQNYEAMEGERTKLMVAEQTQRLVEKQAETDRKRALIEAQKAADVEAVQLARELKVKENEQRMQAIANEMETDRTRTHADAALYRATKEAEANRERLTPEFLQLEAVRALASNTKVFWGDRLPSIYADGASLLTGAAGQRSASGPPSSPAMTDESSDYPDEA
jgi:regulator of protease activity HflC (stomatin/prohibitin superfamily)